MDNYTLGGGSSNGCALLIADVVFYRRNRSTFPENGPESLEVFSTGTQNEDIWKRMLVNAPYLSLYTVSIAFNSALLLMSINKPRKRRWKRLPLLMANLAFCNMILAIGFAAFTLLIDIFYSVQNIEGIFVEEWPLADFCYAALKETLKYQIVHNLVYVQSVLILMITIDRYCSLFPSYDACVEFSWAPSLLTILPYIVIAVFLDFRLQSVFVGTPPALFICIFALIIPCLLALVFTVCTVLRQKQEDISYRGHDRSCPIAMLILINLQLFEKTALFTELMSRNFNFAVVVDDTDSGDYLKGILHIWFQMSHELFVCSPLYIAAVLLVVMRNYRHELFERTRRLLRILLCLGRKDKIDYNCETMRSIIADQTRAKRMRAYAHPTDI